VIRVGVRWNTVSKTFSSPRAEVVWIAPSDYTRISVPEALMEGIRRLEDGDPFPNVDVMWSPEFERLEVSTLRPDGIRAQRVPEDDAWMLAGVSTTRWREWASVKGAQWTWLREDADSGSLRVALPAWVVAVRGDWSCPIRQDILKGTVTGTWPGVTTRDLLQPEPTN
jgi:hypothetical protein